MKRALNLFLGLAVFGPLFFCTASSSKAYGEAADETIVSRTVEIDGIKLHYMTAGQGTPLILLHGRAAGGMPAAEHGNRFRRWKSSGASESPRGS